MNKAAEPSEAAATANGWEFGHHRPDISWRSHKCPGLHQPFFFGWHGLQLQLVDSLRVKSMGDLMPLGEYCLPSSNVFSYHCPEVLTYSIQAESESHERKENANIPEYQPQGKCRFVILTTIDIFDIPSPVYGNNDHIGAPWTRTCGSVFPTVLRGVKYRTAPSSLTFASLHQVAPPIDQIHLTPITKTVNMNGCNYFMYKFGMMNSVRQSFSVCLDYII